MEVIEHVADTDLFIEQCSKLIEKKGVMFVATINKNLKSYIFFLFLAEYILRWLPIGTHDWNKFLTPDELEILCNRNSFKIDQTFGIQYNIFSRKWLKSADASVNYISTFLKN